MHAFRSADEVSTWCSERLDAAGKRLDDVKAGTRRGVTGAEALRAFDALGLELDAASNAAGLLRSVHPEPKIREAAEAGEQRASAFATELSLDRELYEALSRIDAAALDPAGRHFLEKTLRDFRRAGVDKDEATRTRVRALNEELVKIGQEFDANIRTDVRSIGIGPERLEGLPEDWKRAHPVKDGKVTVTTDYPDYVPFMTYAKDGEARRQLYLAQRNRAVPKNLEVLARMLEKRHELARVLGYPNWAAYVTEDKMIGSAENAREFLEKITKVAETRMKADYTQLLARKKKDDPAAEEVFDWERAYWENRVQADEYAFDSQAVRPYFEYRRVKEGLFSVTSTMFGVRYREAKDAAVWHPDVEAWDVFDAKTDAPLGRFYLDMHPREGKYKHAAMFPVATGFRGEHGQQRPEASLVCNFPQPRGKDAALLEHDDVTTFFHEFGHLVHHLLGGHQPWAGVSGIRTEWDFVEAPSQMLEEWCWDVETLQSFARHVETDEPIPADLVARMKRASAFGRGLQVRHQMYYAALSLSVYDRDPKDLDTTALSKELMNRYSPFRFVDGTAFQASFGHLDGYSAIYYTYMWSLVISKDLFGPFRKKGLLDPGVAGRYREAILAPGGSRPAARLVKDFLGRDVEFAAFENWLNEG